MFEDRRARRYCPECDRRVLATAQAPNHVFHLLMCFLTCFLWVIVWLIIVCQSQPLLCTRCGTQVERYDRDDDD